jgi:hypothetical protein
MQNYKGCLSKKKKISNISHKKNLPKIATLPSPKVPTNVLTGITKS